MHFLEEVKVRNQCVTVSLSCLLNSNYLICVIKVRCPEGNAVKHCELLFFSKN